MEPGSRPQDRPTSAEVLPQVQGFRGPCLKTVLISFLCPGTASSHEITVTILSPPTPLPTGHASPTPSPLFSGQTVLFDATHGQANWSQTGFSSREMHTNFAGVMQALCRLGCTCATTNEKPLTKFLPQAKLLVIPPPTGRYNSRGQCWVAQPESFFTAGEVHDILDFLRKGGQLLAFAYRFGDSFTQTNLRDLLGPLGCVLNNDAVIDVTTLRTTHPLQTCFDTSSDMMPLAWFRPGVERVRWRPMATFTLLPGATAQPLAFSPGGRCIVFDRVYRRISFESLPIAVAGLYHQGRFALFGGPHPFEIGNFGLLADADNVRFLQNVLQWLLEDGPDDLDPLRLVLAQPMSWRALGPADQETRFSHVEGSGKGRSTVASLERLLHKTGVLKALGRAKWMP
jgi:hypothetical protein